MPTYRVTSKATGETRLYYGPRPPSEEQADQVFAGPTMVAAAPDEAGWQKTSEEQAKEPAGVGNEWWRPFYSGPTDPSAGMAMTAALSMLGPTTLPGLVRTVGTTAAGVGGAYAGHKLIGGNTGTILGLLGGLLAGGKGASLLAGAKGLQPGLFDAAPIATAAETLPGKAEAFLEAAGSKTHPGLYGTLAQGLAAVMKRSREGKLAEDVAAGVKRLPAEETSGGVATALPREAPIIPNVTMKAGEAGAELPAGVSEGDLNLLMKQLKIPREKAIEIAQANAPAGQATAEGAAAAATPKPSGLSAGPGAPLSKAELRELAANFERRLRAAGTIQESLVPADVAPAITPAAEASAAQLQFAKDSGTKLGTRVWMLLDQSGLPVKQLTPDQAIAAGKKYGKDAVTFVMNLWGQ